MSDTTNDRKLEHLNIIQEDPGVERDKRYFDDIRLRHRALPELDLDQVDTSTTFLGKPLSFPLLISSMTGGDHERVHTINRHLARAAEACGVAMGVGSQRVMFTHPASRPSFDLRPYAPHAPLLANLGAVQLNLGFGLTECRTAVDILQADGLYFHLNPLQEAIQPEGDTCFRGLGARMGEIAAELDVPIILKEVGAGIGLADAELALEHGIHHLDIAGSGGTSWSRIEHHRQDEAGDLGLVFQDWGLPTPEALRLLKPYRDRLTLIASGGIRTGIDMVKAVALGASLCGLASPFLQAAMESADAVGRRIEQLRREFTTAMFLLGMGSVEELRGNTDVFL